MQPANRNSPASRLPVYILAGGRSSRFGSDKARAQIGNMPLLARQAARFTALHHPVYVVTDTPDKYADLGFESLVDVHPDAGPMGGLLTALAYCQSSGGTRALVTACDMLEIQPAWIERLAAAVPPAEAAAFKTDRWHPLPGVYATALLPLVRQHLAQTRGALWQLLEAVHAAPIELPLDWPAIPHANTPAELQAFVEKRDAGRAK